MAHRTVVIGGGAAGIGAAGGVKAADPRNEVVVYTEFEDVGYSPCGIPYVHGKEIDTFERLFLAQKEAYVQAGIDVHYETRVTSIDMTRKAVDVVGEGAVRWDRLVVATGFDYADPGVPGGGLGGLYYVKNIRRAMEWDKVLDTVRSAVVVHATPLGLEMTTALAHRGIETHLVDPQPGRWPTWSIPTSSRRSRTPGWRWASTCTSTPRSRPSTASTSSPASGPRAARYRQTWRSSARTSSPTSPSPRGPA